MAEVKWIKLDKDIFSNRKIKQIEKMPEGDALIVIWLKILTLAGDVNDGGLVYFTRDLPYTEDLLATEFDRPVLTIRLALHTFEKFGMIEMVNDIIKVSNWEKYQSVDRLSEIREYNRLAQQKSRAKKRLPQSVNDMSMTCQSCQGTDIDIEEDKEIEKELETNKRKRFTPPSVDEVRAYCLERGNGIDADDFIDYYGSQKWKKANGRPVEDWKACIRTWERREKQRHAEAVKKKEEEDKWFDSD